MINHFLAGDRAEGSENGGVDCLVNEVDRVVAEYELGTQLVVASVGVTAVGPLVIPQPRHNPGPFQNAFAEGNRIAVAVFDVNVGPRFQEQVNITQVIAS